MSSSSLFVDPADPSETKESGEESVVRAADETVEHGDLKLVAGEGGASTEPGPPRSDRKGVPVWLFALGLLIFVLAAGLQARVARLLEAEVAGLELELARTQAQLDAHRSRLSEIRGGVADLSTRLESLRVLVDSDPLLAASASPTGSVSGASAGSGVASPTGSVSGASAGSGVGLPSGAEPVRPNR